VENLNKLQIHNVKEILAKLTKRFPHTRVSSTCFYHLQQGRTNPKYSIVLRKIYPSGGKKYSKDMQGFLACGLLHLHEALLNVHPYIQILLAVVISSLTNHSRYVSYATFKQVVSNQNYFYLLPSSSSYYGARP
jgi:hypothetical protein